MGEDIQDERYNSFDEYRYNDDIYKYVQGNIGDLYNSFPDDIKPGDTNERDSIIMDCLRLKKYIMEFDNKESCQNKNCCAYINYMLNKRARSYETSHKSIFEYYISYINHRTNDKIKNTCGPKIKYMNENEYAKIEKLKIEILLPYPDECNRLLQKSEHETAFSYEQTVRLAEQEESGRPTDIQRDDMDVIPDENTISPDSFDATLPVTLFSSGIGVLLALLSFYKFTPLGHWLKLRSQRYGRTPKNLDKEEYEMQLHTYEYDERNSECNGYNIAYNSY
ncbi:PIR Superfamily Protein [Plasmodium ovale curtisi]|uniref:PIR Superfamily Protein n=1 Tax=Plasmodium ovale curtisi TaxID=864141 RepID=A0A1A8WR65_PLAOA|nr:PIR Superfamily Protein [Plasmodium ovale curtisi]